jgi:hypothetical protein
VIVHEPAPMMWTVPGEGLVTVQLPLATRLTARPELAVALAVKLGSPNVLFANALKVIV